MRNTEPWLDSAWSDWQGRAEADRVPHALLVAGSAGIGKGRLAERIAAGLLCLAPTDTGEACGECRSCRLLASGAHPERIRLERREDKRFIIVEDLREFIRLVGLSCTISPRKVAIVDPADDMNRATCNALLKTLEEPPGDTVILLVCHDPSRLPATIRSRCQWLDVAPPTAAQLGQWFRDNPPLDEEGEPARFTDAQLEAALKAGGGQPVLVTALLSNPDWLAGFERVTTGLKTVLGQPGKAGSCAAYLEGIPLDLLWSWLSRSSAAALRASLGAPAPDWLEGRVDRLDRACLGRLQAQADRNLAMLRRAAVRQDLLLRDWLLEWSRQRGHADAA